MKKFDFCLVSGSILLSSISSVAVSAQIVPDNTLPTNSQVTSQDSLVNISGGTRLGDQLFHSFEQFSLINGNTAFFDNALDIQNIFSRVTGGTVSNIDGIIRANGTANLFLINPNGIIFGENAALNIGGSFFSSTASSIIFNNGLEFSATNPEAEALLTINMPLGLGLETNLEANTEPVVQGLRFEDSAAPIINRSFVTDASGEFFVGLEVPAGESIALVGGEVLLEGGILTAPEGRIELGSVGRNQTVDVLEKENGWQVDYQKVAAFQDIVLSDFAFVNASGNKGGAIQLQGRNISLIRDSEVIADTFDAKTGATIQVTASENLELSGDFTRIATNAFGTGVAGDLIIKTKTLNISDGAFIGTGGIGDGIPGNLTVNASESINLSGTTSDGFFSSGIFASIENGTLEQDKVITVAAPELIIQDGAQISSITFGTGQSIDITVNAAESVQLLGASAEGLFPSGLLIQIEPEATGDGGTLTLDTKNLLVQDGARISTATFGKGRAGDLTINASESIELTGTELNSGSSGGLSAQVAPGATGDGGTLNVETANLFITEGAQILANTFGAGNAGSLTVEVSESIRLIGTGNNDILPSGLFARVEPGATGDGGTLSVTANELVVLEGAQISTAALEGKGGTLTVDVAESILLSGTSPSGDEFSSSGIFVSAEPGATRSPGELNLNTKVLTVEQGAKISADNIGIAEGNSATLNVQSLIIQDGGQIGAGSLLGANAVDNVRGDGGTLTVNAAESIEITGRGNIGTTPVDSSLFTRAEGTGNAGNLNITTPQLTVSDSGNINVSATGTGEAGTLTVESQEVTLNRGSLTAETRAGNRGNISITQADLLLLFNNSQITTNATEEATGGNITVDSELIALLDNSDVTANAVRGRGGDIQITSQGIFQDVDSDITATSELGIDGTITLNTPDVDPARGLENLPSEVIDVARLIEQNLCQQNKGSEFVLTGKGGLIPSPDQLRSSDSNEVDLVAPVELKDNAEADISPSRDVLEKSDRTNFNSANTIVEAQGWVINQQGNVELIMTLNTDTNSYITHTKSSQICSQ